MIVSRDCGLFSRLYTAGILLSLAFPRQEQTVSKIPALCMPRSNDMGKSLKFDRVANLDYLSAYEVIEKLVELFGVEDVQNALNDIAAKQNVQADDVCPNCGALFTQIIDGKRVCYHCKTPR